VTLPLLYAEEDTGDATERAERALNAVGLAHRARHFPSELSGGEQQRVAIARALINDPAVILADEPTGNLDAQSGREVLEIFRSLVGAGRTLVLVTHDRAVAERADRILSLDDGRIVGEEAIAASSGARSGSAGFA
jgi:predicted ABC-type transport system involved in lysophospholipase L1 biosynthesis ATPase subunit